MGYHPEGNSADQQGLSLRAYAAIEMRVPQSGEPWLDEMIHAANKRDIATAALQGMLANSSLVWNQDTVASTYSDAAAKLAGSLIAELNKEGK